MALSAYIPNFSKNDLREDHGSGTSHITRCPANYGLNGKNKLIEPRLTFGVRRMSIFPAQN